MSAKIINEDNVLLKDIDKYASKIALMLRNKDIIIMKGDLGFGKTTLTRSIAKKLNSENMISSPSFTLINEYDISLLNKKSTLRHIDLYRLEEYDELYNIALDEIIAKDGVTIVEWGNKFIDFFKAPYYILEIMFVSERERIFRLSLEE